MERRFCATENGGTRANIASIDRELRLIAASPGRRCGKGCSFHLQRSKGIDAVGKIRPGGNPRKDFDPAEN